MAHSISEVFANFGQIVEDRKEACHKHGEYVSRLTGMGKSHPAAWTPCIQCLEEKSAAQAEEEALQRQAEYLRINLERKIERARIPMRFKDRTFENYRAATSAQKKAVIVCREYADSFSEHYEYGRGILLLGNVGTGKTHMATAIANQVLQTTKHSVLYVTAGAIIRHVKASFDRDSEYSESDAYNAFDKPGLLIIDEVGVQNATEFELTVMFEVVNSRYEDMQPTMIISNRSTADLPKYLGDRVVDRLRENGGKLAVFDWDSERSKIKGESHD